MFLILRIFLPAVFINRTKADFPVYKARCLRNMKMCVELSLMRSSINLSTYPPLSSFIYRPSICPFLSIRRSSQLSMYLRVGRSLLRLPPNMPIYACGRVSLSVHRLLARVFGKFHIVIHNPNSHCLPVFLSVCL